ncbi:hypothetical protein L9F63_021682, partial [Diploptera punctata]
IIFSMFLKKHKMEIGARFLGFILLCVKWITAPFYFTWVHQSVKTLPPINNPIILISATALAKKIRKKELSSEEVIKAYIARLTEINPFLNAIVEELKESCSVKGMGKCVGSLPRYGIIADNDGAAVSLLRKAGAIPLLISNTPEYCLSWETSNLVTGRTVNPYNPLRSPGGSSGGEAALIGAGASVAGVGSDIAGSIRIPAMFSGIYGHKPTPGYVSIEGHFPNANDPKFSEYLTIGPIVRYAEDIRTMLTVITFEEKCHRANLKVKVDLHKLKVYYMDTAGYSFVMVPVEDAIKKAIHTAAEHLHEKYGIPINEGGFKEMEDTAEISMAMFFGLEDIPNVLDDTAVLHQNNESRNLFLEVLKSVFGMSKFSFSVLIFYCLIATNGFIPKKNYKYYCEQNEALKKKFINVLGDNGVFLYPSYPTAAFCHNQSYSKAAGVVYSMIFNVMGLPTTHVPLGLDKEGMPIGFQVVAAPHQDRLCLAVAEALEKDLGGWVPPSSVQCADS